MSGYTASSSRPRADASEEAAEAIRQLIQKEGLRPGDRIGREVDLVARLGVSRPTLREALRLLTGARLIRASKGPGGGIFVASTPDAGMGQSLSDSIGPMLASESMTLGEALEVRLLIEPPLAGLAARRARPQDIAELDRLVRELASTVHDQQRFGHVDIAIHRHVAAITGNRLALALTAWIGDVLLPSVREQLLPAFVEEAIVEQQRALANAIRKRDAKAAEAAMRAHLMHTVEMMQAADQTASSETDAAK